MTPSEMTLDVLAQDLLGQPRGPAAHGPVRRARHARQGGGSIVNIASMAAYAAGPVVCAYGASKAALLNLTKSMAMEWAPWKIRVNVLSPGPFMSEMVAGAAERNAPGFTDMIAAGTLHQAGRRARRDRRPGALPGQRRVLVRDRRRHLGLGRNAKVRASSGYSNFTRLR